MLGDVITIYHFVTNLENTGNVTKVFVGSAILEVDELAKNYILGGRELGVDVGKQSYASAPLQLSDRPRSIAGNHEVNLVARAGVNDVELRLMLDRLLGG